ncbi:hypothetical protein BDM02DRAFT_3183252 [Thelephora ganbajun]|uniref:Uncharacterized protein n=1 Tax=Thelephora ganbajun TaxID=370292 RepID=A0ACB6ZST2_THEGA|nr:hypothetical protein BDM02DRAFT_3183252 [Thelephora ganbajun]
MSTRNLPTPPPEGPTVTTTEVEQTALPTAGAEEAPAPTNSPPAQSQPTQIHTIYREIFPIIADKAIDRDWSGLAVLAELHDLRTEYDADASRLLLTTPLVLSYLILDDIPPARFALARLPSPLLHHPLTEGLFNLLASTYERKYSQVYLRARALAEALSVDVDLSIFGPSMVKSFVASFRTRAFNLISKAYTSIPVSLAESYLGLPRDELLPTVTRLKWKYNPVTNILTPVRLQNTNARHIQGVVSGPSTLLTFDIVTNGVALLES